jgi:hypothetical protein
VAVLAALTISGVATAHTVTVDALIARVVTEPNTHPYQMTADFTTRATFALNAGKWSVLAVGMMVETRPSGEPRRRKATVTRLDLPVVLRPFSGSIRQYVIDLIETERRLAEFVPLFDIFIQQELGGGRFVLGGVRQDIVTDVMTTYGQTGYLKDPAARRAIARWLYAPSQRASIVRPGHAYVLTAQVDENGLVHQLTLHYDWGVLTNRFAFVTLGGRAFWREVAGDTSTELTGFGRVDGTMLIQFSNHCLNCPPR